jgi:hypothetical protein
MPLFLAMTVNAEIYTWKDVKGISHYTNSMYDVPERYQARVKTVNLGIDEKSADRQQPISTPASAPSTTATVASPQPIAAQPQNQISPAVPAKAENRPARRSRRHQYSDD